MTASADRALAEVLADLLRPAIATAIATEVRQAFEQHAASLSAPARLLTIQEAASLANCHCETIRRAIRAGRLPSVSALGRPRVRPEDLTAFLAPESKPAKSGQKRRRR